MPHFSLSFLFLAFLARARGVSTPGKRNHFSPLYKFAFLFLLFSDSILVFLQSGQTKDVDHGGCVGDLGVDTTYSPCVAAAGRGRPTTDRPTDLPCVIRTNTGIRSGREKKDLFVHCTLENAHDVVSAAAVTSGARSFFSFVGGACPLVAAAAAAARRPRGAEPQFRLAARRALDPDRAMSPTAPSPPPRLAGAAVQV